MAQEDIGGQTLLKGTCLVCNEEFFGVNVCPKCGSKIQLTKEDPLVGNILAERFEVLSKLGEGGMSAVYKARHMLMDKIVAIKLLFASDIQSLKRFQLEAKLACNLNHINIVTVSDFGVSNKGQPYLVMDYLEGRSLGDCVKIDGPMQLNRALGIFTQACDALTYAHKKDVIHRDLKPSNFMLVLDDSFSELLKVVDFGIAKQINFDDPAGQGLTKTGEVFGSPLYMAPEQCLGRKLDARADIYSMGCVMYEVLTGAPPLVGVNALDTLHKHINEDPQPFAVANPACANLPPMLEKLVFKALARDLEQRYQTMFELWADLNELKHVVKGGSVRPGSVPLPQISPSPPLVVNPGMINTIPQGMTPPLLPHESLIQSPTVPPGFRAASIEDQYNTAAPAFYGQSQTRAPGQSQHQLRPAAQSGQAAPAHNQGTNQQSGQARPQQQQGSPPVAGQPSARGPGLPAPFVQGAPATHNAPQDATVVSSRMQAIQSSTPPPAPSNVVPHSQPQQAANFQANAAANPMPHNPTPGMSNSRLASLGHGRDANAGNQQLQSNQFTAQMPRTASGGAPVPRPRAADASRQALRAQTSRKFPVIPVAIAAAVVIIGGGIVAFLVLSHPQKQDIGTLPGSVVSPVSHAPATNSDGNSGANGASSSGWQEAEAAGAKALEDANYQLAFKQLSIAKEKATGHPLDEEYGQLLALYGQAASKTDHFGAAIDALSQAQSIFGSLNGPQYELSTAACKNCLGLVYTNQMDYKNAKAFLTEAKAIRDKVGKPEDKADSEQAMAKLYNRFQKRDSYGTDEAIKLLNDAIVTHSKGGDDLAFTIECNNAIGFSYTSKGEFTTARNFFDKALAAAAKNFGPQHPLYADSLVGLGTLNFIDKKYDLANKQFEDALFTRQENYGPNTIKVAEVYSCLGLSELAQKHLDRAAKFYKMALDIKKNLLGEDNPEVKHTADKYAMILGRH